MWKDFIYLMHEVALFISGANPPTTKEEKTEFYKAAFADFTERGGQFINLVHKQPNEKYQDILYYAAKKITGTGLRDLWKTPPSQEQDKGSSSTIDGVKDDRKPAAVVYPPTSNNPQQAVADILPAATNGKRPRSESIDSWVRSFPDDFGFDENKYRKWEKEAFSGTSNTSPSLP